LNTFFKILPPSKRDSFYLLIFLFFLSSSALGQGLIIYDDTSVFAQNYRYEDHQDQNSMPNFAIRKMARITAPTRAYFIGFKLFLRKQIKKTGKNDYQFLIQVDSVQSYNRLNFLGYQLDSLVFPNLVHLHLDYLDANSQRNYVLEFEDNFKLTHKLLINKTITDSSGMAFFVWKNLQLDFSYSDSIHAQLERTLDYIVSLEELKPKLKQIRKKMQQLNGVKAAVVGMYNSDLKKIEQELELNNPQKQITSAELLAFRNEGVVALHDSLYRACTKLRKRFDIMSERPEYEYYSDGYKAYLNGDFNLSVSHLQRAIRTKHSFAPPYYYLAEIAYYRHEYDSAISLFKHILKGLSPDISIKQKTLNLGSKIYNSIVDEAKMELNNKNVNQSIQLLYKALDLCEASEEFVCNDEAQQLMKKARQEMFDSWVSITQTSISTQNQPMALNYLRWTQNFLSDYRQQVSDTSQMDSLRLGIHHLLVRRGFTYMNQNRSQQALENFRQADSLATRMHLGQEYYVHDTLYAQAISMNQQAQRYSQLTNGHNIPESSSSSYPTRPNKNLQTRYDNAYKIARTEFEEKNYFNAYSYFTTAYELQNSSITPYDSLNIYRLESGRQVIMSDLRSGELAAWGAQRKTVKSIMAQAKNEMRKLGLEKDSILNAEIKQLYQLAFENHCLNTSAEFTRKMKQGNISAKMKQYLLASKQWKEALQIARNNPECTMDSTLPQELIQHFAHASTFQQMQKTLHWKLNNQQDSLAFELAKEMEIFYRIHDLKQFELHPYGPHELLSGEQNNLIMNHLYLNYLIDEVNTDSALFIQSILQLDQLDSQKIYGSTVDRAIKDLCLLDFHLKLEKKQIKERAKQYFPNHWILQRKYVKNALFLTR
jgi:hypothetical protein